MRHSVDQRLGPLLALNSAAARAPQPWIGVRASVLRATGILSLASSIPFAPIRALRPTPPRCPGSANNVNIARRMTRRIARQAISAASSREAPQRATATVVVMRSTNCMAIARSECAANGNAKKRDEQRGHGYENCELSVAASRQSIWAFMPICHSVCQGLGSLPLLNSAAERAPRPYV